MEQREEGDERHVVNYRRKGIVQHFSCLLPEKVCEMEKRLIQRESGCDG